MTRQTPPKLAADLADFVTAGGRPTIDLDTALVDGIKADAAEQNADAVLAEIEARRLELAVEYLGDDDNSQQRLDEARKIAAARRRRADGLFAMSGLKRATDLVLDMRLFVASQLKSWQADQVKKEHRLANLDLYAVDDDEATAVARHPNSQPQTAERIRTDALLGRAQIGAYVEWLTAHADDGPLPKEDKANPEREQGLIALRRFMGKANITGEVIDTNGTERGQSRADKQAEADALKAAGSHPDAGALTPAPDAT